MSDKFLVQLKEEVISPQGRSYILIYGTMEYRRHSNSYRVGEKLKITPDQIKYITENINEALINSDKVWVI